ncbi:MAG: bifunctional diaminohydroxyphosphoribosylaminopyrimidine deaminase/5-amino-6-(5-phosphoribosylamino)uracil reductase RibD [Pseudomonadota bacterium]
MFSADDTRHMARALKLAARGRYTAQPNPMVGCVIVRDGKVLGEGWHRRAGEAHAEVAAIRSATAELDGATAYVSLEPCSHHGRTPPCADALIEKGIKRVVAAMRDPNPAVSGGGIARLENAGVSVETGLLETEAERLNSGFVKRMRKGRPFVRLKIASSIDGATGMASGESQWITGPAARADVQRLRAESGAILTGIGTVIADDPRLTVRDELRSAEVSQPLRVILDSDLRTPVSVQLLRMPGETRIYYCGDNVREDLADAGATLVGVAEHKRGVDLGEVLDDLGRLEVNSVLVEAGATLAGSLVSGAFVDELIIYQAPQLLGSSTRPMLSTPGWRRLQHRLQLEIKDIRMVGRDLRIVARPLNTVGS